LSFTKSTENSNTRISLGASSTDGIVKNTGLDKYNATVYNSNFFGGAMKRKKEYRQLSVTEQTPK
jgi:iron complex outermembrane receptor protein